MKVQNVSYTISQFITNVCSHSTELNINGQFQITTNSKKNQISQHKPNIQLCFILLYKGRFIQMHIIPQTIKSMKIYYNQNKIIFSMIHYQTSFFHETLPDIYIQKNLASTR